MKWVSMCSIYKIWITIHIMFDITADQLNTGAVAGSGRGGGGSSPEGLKFPTSTRHSSYPEGRPTMSFRENVMYN
jgi:hypothetical protein